MCLPSFTPGGLPHMQLTSFLICMYLLLQLWERTELCLRGCYCRVIQWVIPHYITHAVQGLLMGQVCYWGRQHVTRESFVTCADVGHHIMWQLGHYATCMSHYATCMCHYVTCVSLCGREEDHAYHDRGIQHDRNVGCIKHSLKGTFSISLISLTSSYSLSSQLHSKSFAPCEDTIWRLSQILKGAVVVVLCQNEADVKCQTDISSGN